MSFAQLHTDFIVETNRDKNKVLIRPILNKFIPNLRTRKTR